MKRPVGREVVEGRVSGLRRLGRGGLSCGSRLVTTTGRGFLGANFGPTCAGGRGNAGFGFGRHFTRAAAGSFFLFVGLEGHFSGPFWAPSSFFGGKVSQSFFQVIRFSGEDCIDGSQALLEDLTFFFEVGP